MSNESPEVIEREMASTRQSLTDKVAAFEDQVAGTLHSATTTVQDTIDSLKSAVSDTVETVRGTVGSVAESVKGTVGSVTDDVQHAVHSAAEGVKDTFNVSHHVRNNPWVAVGSSTAVGFLTGLLCFRQAKKESAPVFIPFRTHEPAPAPVPAQAAAPRRPGLFDDLLKRLTDEVGKVAETALKTLSESVTRSVHDGIPKMVDGAVSKVAHTLQGAGTEAGGGHGSRIRESDWE